jgi:hypothetical protein
MSDSTRPKPFQPRGAVDGAVVDSTLAKNMSLDMRFGNSCGIPFIAKDFCQQHRQWSYLEAYLVDRPSQPWTVFSIESRSLPLERYATNATNRIEGGGRRRKKSNTQRKIPKKYSVKKRNKGTKKYKQ